MTLNRIQLLISVAGSLIGIAGTFLLLTPPAEVVVTIAIAASFTIVGLALGSWRGEHPDVA
jgi:hypothetical protein